GGKWSIGKVPACVLRYCGPVPQIDNGFAVNATNVTYGGAAVYQCYAGFRFTSGAVTEQIRCLEDGQWSKLPQCSAASCPALPELSPGQQPVALRVHLLTGDGSSYGSIFGFECASGYQRVGMPSIICESNGRWSGRPPVCERIFCQAPPIIPNGYLVHANGTLLLNTATYSALSGRFMFENELRVQCHRGYRLTGSSIIKCTADRVFSEPPVCEDINECAQATSNGVCDLASTTCENAAGGFHCKCKAGFEPNLDCRPAVDLGLGG